MKRINTVIPFSVVHTLSVSYLLLPFLLFTAFWLSQPYALLVGVSLIYCWILCIKHFADSQSGAGIDLIHWKQLLIGGLILAVWLLFSGIGGFAYQNSDFMFRNAILRDLIQHEWPVLYNSDQHGNHQSVHEQSILVYYIGYWLPSAVIGKLLGWKAGNIFLYLWTLLGLLLIFVLLCQYIKVVSYKIILIFIVWSGLDIVGALIGPYAGHHPFPVSITSDIEWWGVSINTPVQFSSNSTLLYWVFNQTLPIWLTTLLVLNGRSDKILFFLITLTLFQAPFGTIGLIPFIGYQLISKLNTTTIKLLIHNYLSFPNTLGALLVLLVTTLYFTVNQAGTRVNFASYGVLGYAAFFLLEIGILAILIRKGQQVSLLLFSVGLLFFIPFIKIGYYNDFAMRASIPAVLILTVLTIKFMFNKRLTLTEKLLVGAYLLIGSFTPALEIIRSVLYTGSHVVYSLDKKYSFSDSPNLPIALKNRIMDKPLINDQLITLENYTDSTFKDQFISRVGDQPFCRYFLRK